MPEQHTSKNKWDDLTPYERRNLASHSAHCLLAERYRNARAKKPREEDATVRILASLGIELRASGQYVGELRLPYEAGSPESLRQFVDEVRVEPIQTEWLDAQIREMTDGQDV